MKDEYYSQTYFPDGKSEVEPQSFIRVHPNELWRGFRIALAILALFVGAVFYEAASGLDQWQRFTLACSAGAAIVLYAELRMKKNRRGWYLYEHEGKIVWYIGSFSEQSLEISRIVWIDETGLASLADKSKVRLPNPDETWYPFYLHLHKTYPLLFEKKPVLRPRD